MDNKTLKKFRDITRHSSIYIFFDNASNINNQKPKLLKYKVEKLEALPSAFNKKHKFVFSSKSNSYSNKELDKINKINILSNIENYLINNNNTNSKNKIYNFKNHIYKENKIEVQTNKPEILKEIKNTNIKDNYYKRFVSENNFGEKFSKHYQILEDFSKSKKEDNLIKMGLNSEEKNPFNLIDKKGKVDFNFKLENNYSKYDNFNYLLLRSKKCNNNKNNFINNNTKSSPYLKNLKLNNIKSQNYKEFHTSSFMRKYEFSNYLIIEFIKKNYPSLIMNKDSTYIFFYFKINEISIF